MLKYASSQLKKDRDVVFTAVCNNGEALQYASKEFRKDKEIVLAAVRSHSRALFLASEELKEDKQFLIECYRIKKDTVFNNFIKQFDKLENGIFYYSFIKKNVDILDLVENKEQLYEYLLKNKKYDIIYQNEDIALDIKDKNKVIVLSFSDIDPEKEYDKNKLKEEHKNRNIGLKVEFIN
jgi:hypothetical protein